MFAKLTGIKNARSTVNDMFTALALQGQGNLALARV